MGTIVLKNLPAGLRKRLELRARSSGRSVEEEAIACLQSVVGEPGRGLDQEATLLADVRKLREEIAAATGLSITNADIDAAKRKGRP